MNQEFEVKLLLKQNSEMVSKIQVYRRQNQALSEQNHDLNLWVQNLSEVFAAIGAAWKTITNNEEALFNLMKKKDNANSKALISKYVSHFKTFDEIIDKLGDKIKNSGHSNEATIDAKARLNAFVQNYEMFFKELADAYFKFNDEYLQWVTELKNKQQLSQTFRNIANKEIQNKMKIKEFEGFMNEFRGRTKIYESQNQHKLLDGILFSKNQQINSLNQLNQKLTRRLNLVFNYSTENAQAILEAEDKDHECFCGGIHLQYFKKEWEHHLEELRNQNDKGKNPKSGDLQTISSMNREDYEIMEFEKQRLFERISVLQGRIEKMKTQNRLSEDLVVNSSAYTILHSQTQELIIFVDQLIQKISNHYTLLYQIEKTREEEILELKAKLQKGQSNSTQSKVSQNLTAKVQTNLIEFKTNVTEWIKQLNKEYTELNGKISQKQEILSKSKEYISELQKEVVELKKRIETLESNKAITLEFRHEKFNQVEKKITELIQALPESQNQEKQKVSVLWKEFVEYVKSRDKKIKDLQLSIKKKEKQITQKDKLVSVLQEGLKQTENVFISTQAQVKAFGNFIINTEKQLHSLAEKNLSLKLQFEQQKMLLNYKMKAENDSKAKMQQKIKYYETIEDQIKQIKKITQETQLNYENWIVQQEKKLMETLMQLQEIKRECDMKKVQAEEMNKTKKKLIEEKEKQRLKSMKLEAQLKAIEEKSEIHVVKMQMQEYKRKLMCNCSRDQQRSVVLKTCPHAFCKKCIQDMNNSRNRKCPLCGVKFGKSDLHDIILC